MDESISSSPRSNRSIQKVRQLRKSKRQLNETINDTNECQIRTLDKIYYDSDEDDNSQPDHSWAIGNKFEMERLLCLADRMSSSTNRKPLKELPESQGFLTCEMLTQQLQEPADNSFVITDTQLLNCCNEVDQMLLNSPNTDLQLVNSILADFSLSPVTTVPVFQQCFDYTPEFKMKRIPTKTYSRKRGERKQIECNKRLKFQPASSSDEEDCSSSRSSILSIQENNSQLNEMLDRTVIPENMSERLNENLLNLSAFYTQCEESTTDMITKSSTQDSMESDGDLYSVLPSENMLNIIQEIISLRQKSSNKLQHLDSFNSDQEFQGFPEYDKSDDIDEDISLSDDNYDDPLNTTLLSPPSFHVIDEDSKMVLYPDADNTNVAACTDVTSTQSYDGWNEDCSDMFAQIKTQQALQQQYNNSSKDLIESVKLENISNRTFTVEKEIHENIDEDLFDKAADYMNLVGLKNQNQIDAKPIAQRILFDTPSTSKAAGYSKTEGKTSLTGMGLQTAGGKRCILSSKGRETLNKFVKEFSADFQDAVTNQIDAKSLAEHQIFFDKPTTSKAAGYPKPDDNLTKRNSLIGMGLQTAGKKPCNITSKGRETSNKFLSEFTTDLQGATANEIIAKPLTEQEIFFEKPSTSKAAMHSNTQDKKPKGHSLIGMGLQTAGGKPCEISSKGRETLDKLLKEFNTDWQGATANEIIAKPLAEQHILFEKPSTSKTAMHPNIKDTNPNGFSLTGMGLQTAAGKLCDISSKGRETLDKLLKEFNTDLQCANENDLELLKNKNRETGKNAAIKMRLESKAIHLNDFKKCPGDINRITPQCIKNDLKEASKSSFTKENLNNVQSDIAANSKCSNELATLKQELENDLESFVFSEWPLEDELSRESSNIAKANSCEKVLEATSFNKSNIAVINNEPPTTFQGLKTASGKDAPISNDYMTKLINEFQLEDKAIVSDKYLIQTKRKLQLKNCKLKRVINNTNSNSIVNIKVSSENIKDAEDKSRIGNFKYDTQLNCQKQKDVICEEGSQNRNHVNDSSQTSICNHITNKINDSKTDAGGDASITDLNNIPNFKLNESNNALELKIRNSDKISTDHIANISMNSSKTMTDLRKVDSVFSPLTEVKRSFTEMAVRSPLTSIETKSLISRKNLLSLSKRRKISNNTNSIKANQTAADVKVINDVATVATVQNEETPIKTKRNAEHLRAASTPVTPNLKEFFNSAAQCSTPQTECKPAQDMDSGLNAITWDADTSNKSQLVTTTANTSFNSPKPTVKERIARLQSYGNPPAISPISSIQNIRLRVGLRPPRRMFKKPKDT